MRALSDSEYRSADEHETTVSLLAAPRLTIAVKQG